METVEQITEFLENLKKEISREEMSYSQRTRISLLEYITKQIKKEDK